MDLARVQQAAVSCFARQGFAATGIRELGATAGLNSATLYHYVGSKQDLLLKIMRDCLDSMIHEGEKAVAAHAEPTEQLAALIAFHVGFTATNPQSCRVAEQEMRALGEPARSEIQALRDDYENLFAHVLSAGAQSKAFSARDLGLARLAIMEMCTGVSHWYRPDGRMSLPEVQQTFTAMAFSLLAVPTHRLQTLPAPQPAVRLASEPAPDLT